mgnify:CR=1 FL=1
MTDATVVEYADRGRWCKMTMSDGSTLEGAIFSKPSWRICSTPPGANAEWSSCTNFSPAKVDSIEFAD